MGNSKSDEATISGSPDRAVTVILHARKGRREEKKGGKRREAKREGPQN